MYTRVGFAVRAFVGVRRESENKHFVIRCFIHVRISKETAHLRTALIYKWGIAQKRPTSDTAQRPSAHFPVGKFDCLDRSPTVYHITRLVHRCTEYGGPIVIFRRASSPAGLLGVF